MNDNPYATPQSAPDGNPTSMRRWRLAPGNVVFLGLGLLFLAGACGFIWMAFDASLPRPRRMEPLFAAGMLGTLGGLLICHGIWRSQATILAILIVFFAIFAFALFAMLRW